MSDLFVQRCGGEAPAAIDAAADRIHANCQSGIDSLFRLLDYQIADFAARHMKSSAQDKLDRAKAIAAEVRERKGMKVHRVQP